MDIRDSRTGETVTPESITEQLRAQGIEIPEEVSEVAEVSTEVEIAADPEEESENAPPEIEVEAAKHGWKPEGIESAAEFMRSRPLYEEIKKRGKELKEVKATVDELKAHMDKQRQLGYQDALKQLQEQRLEAISRGDAYGVDVAERALEEHKLAEPKPQIVTEFLAKNSSWINEKSDEADDMRTLAHTLDATLAARKLSPEEHIAKVEETLRKVYPHRFGIQEESAPISSSVESAVGREQPKRRTKFKFSDLTEEQRSCARHFEKYNVMSIDEYIKGLVSSGELK